MKRILFIHPHAPIFGTPSCGAINRSRAFLNALTYVGHVDVVLFHAGEESDIPNCDVIYADDPGFDPLKEYSRIGKFLRLFAPWNANNIFPVNKSVETFLDKIIEKGKYDYIAVRYLYLAAEFGLLKYADKLVLDVDDNPRNTLLIRSKNASSIQKGIYYKLASVSAIFMSRIVLKKVFCSFYSNKEQSPSDNSIFLHNVSVHKEILSPVNDTTPRNVLIIGRWAYYPNRHGLLHFLSKIWLQILSQEPQAKLRIVGEMEDMGMKKKCLQFPNVDVVGFVDDIMQEYKDARCVIIPIYHGSGTCVKTIETMQVNRPFVSTICGVRGLENDIQTGKDYLLANNDVRFAEHVVNLLKHPEYGASLAANAQHCVQEKYSIEQFNKIIAESIQQ